LNISSPTITSPAHAPEGALEPQVQLRLVVVPLAAARTDVEALVVGVQEEARVERDRLPGLVAELVGEVAALDREAGRVRIARQIGEERASLEAPRQLPRRAQLHVHRAVVGEVALEVHPGVGRDERPDPLPGRVVVAVDAVDVAGELGERHRGVERPGCEGAGEHQLQLVEVAPRIVHRRDDEILLEAEARRVGPGEARDRIPRAQTGPQIVVAHPELGEHQRLPALIAQRRGRPAAGAGDEHRHVTQLRVVGREVPVDERQHVAVAPFT
jgi:hypothetical protein